MNLAKLNGVITEKSKINHVNMKKVIADALGISLQAVGKKLSGETKINTSDAQIMSDVLDLDYHARVDIFLPISSHN